MKKIPPTITIFLIGSFLFLSLLSHDAPFVLAQSGDEDWAIPVNLSHSGAATRPAMLVDSTGIIHVIWQDEFAGTVYTENQDGVWISPVAISLPFRLFTPSLLADGAGQIQAFWLDTQGTLFHSQVPAGQFGNPAAWAVSEPLADSVAAFEAATAGDRQVHLAYASTRESANHPAGIYYRRSPDGGISWSLPLNLYSSAYFRSLTGDTASVHITAAAQGSGSWVYLTWDNRPRRQLFIARSLDGGESWEEPLEVDPPQENSGSDSPFDLQVAARDDQVLLVWQDGDMDVSCTQRAQWSLDGAKTWSRPQPLSEQLSGCSTDNRFFIGQNGLVLLLTSVQDQAYLLAWDGSQWSKPQSQPLLSSFEDPEIYTQVTFGCRQAALVEGNQISVVGCDLNGGDIWFTSLPFGSLEDWFPPPSAWSQPESILESSGEIASPVLVSDSQDRFHAFWSQTDDASASGSVAILFYAHWDGERWSQPLPVLETADQGADQPAVAIDGGDRLYLVWRERSSGAINFSSAAAGRAYSASEWSPPVVLPHPERVSSSPEILVDPDGRIWVVYAVPYNERRGVYLTQSADGGKTWSNPVCVFDAAAAGWEAVDHPHLAFTPGGQPVVIWTQYAAPGNTDPLALYSARSEDGGETWSEPELVVEGKVLWSRIAGSEQVGVSRIWQEEADNRTQVKVQLSLDGGITWSIPQGISSLGDQLGAPAVHMDAVGQLHLLQVIQDYTGKTSLQGQTWSEEKWSPGEALDLSRIQLSGMGELAAAISAGGRLGVIFTGDLPGGAAEPPQEALFFSSRVIEVPEVVATLSVPTTSPATPTPTQANNPIPTPTPTPNLSDGTVPGTLAGSAPFDNKWSGLFVGGGLSGGIVILGFLSYWMIRRRNGR